jgi:hypothetical protein
MGDCVASKGRMSGEFPQSKGIQARPNAQVRAKPC